MLLSSSVVAQRTRVIKGIVKDTLGRPVPDISVRLTNNTDTLSTFTDASGNYNFNQVKSQDFSLLVSYNDSILFSANYTIKAEEKSPCVIPTITIKLWPKALEEVIVRPPPVTVKEDTIQFNAAAFRVRDGAVVEELIKKFPGLTVDKDGNITAQGKPVTKLRVNGKDFFAGDILTATQNLPADIVRNIQIIDDYGEQANLTGIKTGEPQKVININTKKDKNKGVFGSITGGVGTEDRYLANVSLNRFNDDRQLSLIATANNTNLNANAFSGSGRNSGSRPSSGGAGITKTYALGLNYRTAWGKKLSVYGSYSFSSHNNYTEGLTYQQDFNPLNTRITNRSNTSSSDANSHRVNCNMEYTIDPRTFLKLSATGSYSAVGTSGSSVSTISRSRFFTDNRGTSDAASDNSSLSANAVINHRFNKQGRNLNINAIIDYGRPLQRNRIGNLVTDVDSGNIDSLHQPPLVTSREQLQRQEIDNTHLHSGVYLSYTEPFSEHLTAELSYSLSYDRSVDDRNVFDLDTGTGYEAINPGLTNHYHSTFYSSRYGISIQSRHKRYNYLVGILAQPSVLDGFNHSRNQETHYANTNWAPAARFVYRFTNSQTLTLNYNGTYREPDFQKLQPVVDSTNPSNITVGNPDLRPEFTNRLSASYNASNKETGSALFADISYDKTLNRIVNSVFNDPASTSRTTTYLNDDGFYRIAGNASVSQPFSSRKYVITAGFRGNFDNNISYTDNQRSKGQNWVLQPNARVLIDFPDIIEAELNASYTINRSNTVYPGQTITTETRAFALGLSGRVFCYKDLSLGYDYSKSLNYGYGGQTASNPDILSLFLEYRFMKRKSATIRLQGFDLLNQNTRISRTVSGTTITDSRNNGLQRYFVLAAEWKLASVRK